MIQAGSIFLFVPDISSAKSAAEKMVDLFDSTAEIDAESTEGLFPQNVQGRVRLQNIHFGYPTRPGAMVLNDFSLTVEPGKFCRESLLLLADQRLGSFVAIVGPSGSGKSTMIQLIERFYDSLTGSIYVSIV